MIRSRLLVVIFWLSRAVPGHEIAPNTTLNIHDFSTKSSLSYQANVLCDAHLASTALLCDIVHGFNCGSESGTCRPGSRILTGSEMGTSIKILSSSWPSAFEHIGWTTNPWPKAASCYVPRVSRLSLACGLSDCYRRISSIRMLLSCA